MALPETTSRLTAGISGLDLGSEAIPQAATPPTGAELGAAIGNPLGNMPRPVERAMPTATPPAPKAFEMGPTSPIRQAYEDNPLFQIGSVLSSYGEKVPTNITLKLAQQEAQLKESQNQLQWDAHNRANVTLQQNMKMHNIDMMQKAQSMYPMYKAMLTNEKDPEKRANLLKSMKQTLNGLSPGSGDYIEHFAANPANGYFIDAMLAHPDPKISGDLQKIANVVGYEGTARLEQLNKMADAALPDLLHVMKGHFPQPMAQKLADGKMNETEFRDQIKAAGFATQTNPVLQTAVHEFMNTPRGQQLMNGMGVELDATKLIKENKQKEMTPEQQAKAADLKRATDVLDFESKNPGSIDKAKLLDAQDRVDRATGQKNKESTYSDNNPLVPFLLEQSKGQFKDPVAMMETVDQKTNPKEYARRLGILKAANDAKAAAMSEGQMGTKMSQPVDTSQYIYADKLLQTGHAIPVREVVTQGQLLTNKNFVKATPEQKKELRDLNTSISSAHDIFEQADKAFSGHNSKLGIAAAEVALMADDKNPLNIPGKLAAKSAYPELATYVARREETLGKFARGISGEVGVLTDQDVGRVRNIFPNATDTAIIRKAKEKSLNALLALNRKYASEVLAGELSPDEAAALKESPRYRSAANGALEGWKSAGNSTPKKEAKSLAEPAGSTQAQPSLFKQMGG